MIFLIFFLHNLKRADARLFFRIATTTNIKTKTFGICFLVTSWCNKRKICSQSINFLKLHFFPNRNNPNIYEIRFDQGAGPCSETYLRSTPFPDLKFNACTMGKNVFWRMIFIFAYQRQVSYRIQWTTTNFRQERPLLPCPFQHFVLQNLTFRHDFCRKIKRLLLSFI